MTILWIFLALFLCGVTLLSSYMHLLFVHSLPIRARENPATVKHFEEDLKPHLGENTQQSLFRYALAQQLSLVMLVIVLMALLSEGDEASWS